MRNDGTAVPEGTKFVTARVLTSGTITYELSTSNTASWLALPNNATDFANHFSSDAVVRRRTYPLIVENVPLSFDPASDTELRRAETLNELLPGSLASAKWIKDVGKRESWQSNAYVMLQITTKEVANQVL
ncbi:hypothetical protein CONPUDRAFT_62781, partial [Coniophora puteana RWD-64-598 SS2]